MFRLFFKPKLNFFSPRGFTLVEAILVVGIFLVLFVSSLSLVSNQTTQDDLEAKAEEVADLVSRARNYAATGYQGDVWGIKILDSDVACVNSGDCLILFKGSSYATRDANYDQILNLNTGSTITADQGKEFSFKYISGWLSTSTAQTIDLTDSNGQEKSVVIGLTGYVSTFVCGQDKVEDAGGNMYATVLIGSQCWLGENLRVGRMLAAATTDPTNNSLAEKWCWSDNSANCSTREVFYNWDEAMQYSTTAGAQGLCPGGWHIPTDTEFTTLVDSYAITDLTVGGTSGFNLDIYSGGEMDNSSHSYVNGANHYFWTSTQSGGNAWVHAGIADPSGLSRAEVDKGWGLAVRCLKN
jgi:uncharacterized protein (TIGR02145 family)